jgi:hypothetical protein
MTIVCKIPKLLPLFDSIAVRLSCQGERIKTGFISTAEDGAQASRATKIGD